jgi:tetratricopeptide (TPR) repeat protein
MKRPVPGLLCIVIAAMVFLPGPEITAQSGETDEPQATAGPAETPALEPAPASSGVIFPKEQPGLIYVEAEDAVSTNFAQEPTLDYSSSGQRMLQLNRFTALGAGQRYFAEYVFLVEEAGAYEFWIAGTPPGPRDQIFPSYVSPFRYAIDEEPEVPVYREDVAVVEQFSATNFWYLTDRLELSEGVHRIRFIVDEKRRFDSKFYFFLDSFFLLADGTSIDPELVSDKFPADMEDRSIDNAYRSINEYEYLITQDPENIQVYLSIAQVYSLLGDYLNALKYLIRGLAYEPENAELLKLVAKNRIWKGDVIEGLAAFNRYFELYPEDVETIAEAAKIAAWTNRFTESYRLYAMGLEIEPDNFTLKVNLGLTYLWNSRIEEGLTVLRESLREAADDPDKLEELARVYLANSYPSYAVDVYQEAVRIYPRHLQFYLGLSEAYQADDRPAEAAEVVNSILSVLGENPLLEGYIEAYNVRQGLKDQVIQEYRDQLAANPDDLALRELLVQTLFWNGQRREAVEEYLNIMGNRLLREIRDMEDRSADLLALMDEMYVYRNSLAGGVETVQGLRRGIQEANRGYLRLSANLQSLEDEGRRLAELEAPSEAQTARLGELPDLISEARGLRDREGQALADLMDGAEEYIRRSERMAVRVAEIAGQMEPVRADAADEQERLANLSSQISWSWNREDSSAELERIRSSGNVLGDYLILSIARNRSASEIDPAQVSLLEQRSQNFPDGRHLAAQLKLWSGESEVPDDYFRYGPELASRISSLVGEYEPMGLFDPSLVDAAALDDLDSRLVATAAANRGRAADLEGSLAEAHELFDKRLIFAMYLFDTGTYLTRYQIGEYSLALGEYDEAARQFRSVLRIDPYNANARFRLASVKQLAGDWSGAMDDYLQVYYADPGFENVRQLYNQLARENATVLQIQAQSLADSARWNNRLSFSLVSPVSTVLEFTAAYRVEDLRLHKPTAAGENPSTASLQTLEFSVPVSLGGISTRIRPAAGMTIDNRIFEDDYSDVPSPVLPENITGALFLSPILGLGTDTQLGPVNIALDYRWYRLEDSFFIARDPALAHSASLTLGTYFGFPNRSSLNSFGTRTYANARIVTQELKPANVLITAVQDLVLSTHVADSPWSNLDFVITASFEDSTLDDPQSDYYAPQNVLVGKFGVNFATWIGGLPNARVLGLMPRLAVGYFGENLGRDGAASSLLIDGGMKFEITQGTGSQYVELGTSLALGNDEAGNFALGYFTFYANVGLYATFPTLLN